MFISVFFSCGLFIYSLKIILYEGDLEMKNKHSIGRLVGILCIVVGALVGIVLLANAQYIAGIIVAAILIVGGIITYTISTNNSRRFCDKCGASMDGCAYHWEEIDRVLNDKGDECTSTVDIQAECPECGKIKKYKKKFTLPSWKTEGDLENEIKKYIKSVFGH